MSANAVPVAMTASRPAQPIARYAVDLDGVFFDSNMAMLQAINERFGTGYCLADIRTWEWHEWCPDEHWRHAFGSFAGLVAAGLPLLPGAFAGLRRLAAAGGVSVITHRTPDLSDLTARALAGLPHQAIHHVDRAVAKAVVAGALGCRVALEDSPAQALAYAEAGLRVYLFAYPYNAHVRHPLVTHVQGWMEVLAGEGLTDGGSD